MHIDQKLAGAELTRIAAQELIDEAAKFLETARSSKVKSLNIMNTPPERNLKIRC